jgi:hypothetical protein
MNALVPRRWQPLVIASVLIGIVVLLLINVDVEEGEEGGLVPAIVSIALLLLATFLLWRFVVTPRVGGDGVAAAAGTVALVLGVLALLTGFVFWSGLVFAFAPAAVALGLSTADQQGRIAAGLGVLGLVLAIALVISDQA